MPPQYLSLDTLIHWGQIEVLMSVQTRRQIYHKVFLICKLFVKYFYLYLCHCSEGNIIALVKILRTCPTKALNQNPFRAGWGFCVYRGFLLCFSPFATNGNK